MKHTQLSKSKLRELKLRKKKRAIIASRNVNSCVNNMPKDKPTFDLKVLKKVVFGGNCMHYVQEAKPWKQEEHKQPKSFIKSKARKYSKPQHVTDENGIIHISKVRFKPTRRHDHECTKHNDFVKFILNYPYNPPKMTQQAYWEKLVQHKLAKWERKNPQPCSDDDMFTEKLVEWKDKREKAVERFRDVVVSAYDKLKVVAVDDKKETLLATIKDDADRMKVLKTASKIQDAFHRKHPKVLNYKLYDHKPKKVLMETHKLAA